MSTNEIISGYATAKLFFYNGLPLSQWTLSHNSLNCLLILRTKNEHFKYFLLQIKIHVSITLYSMSAKHNSEKYTAIWGGERERERIDR